MKMGRLARVARIATLPETRNVIFAAVRSTTLRTGLRRAIHDPSGVVRELRPATVQSAVMRGVRHPAVQELANAGLLLLPGRYIPLGWAATWAARHVRRRHRNPTIAASWPEPYGPDHLGTWRQGARDTTSRPAPISQEL